MKLSIIGMGKVGQAIAFAAVVKELVDDLVLVGRTPQSALGDALDLRHASCFSRPATVRSGSIADTVGSDMIIVTAAVQGGHKFVHRYQAVESNAAMFREMIPPLAKLNPQAVFLIVTNPVDALTQIAQTLSGLPHHQVIGTGTLIDTVRLRALLAEKCKVHTADLRIYVLGEHGDSQVAILSSASAGGAPLDVTDADLKLLAAEASNAGHAVATSKGYTSSAVAMAVILIVEAVMQDTHTVLPVSTRLQNYHGVNDVCVSVPAVIGRSGVIRTLAVNMDDDERRRFQESAAFVQSRVQPYLQSPSV